MGSSGSGAADWVAGSIVWVRRRNGSWWPGKILGPEELSTSHLMSPRSGTPVKLLGREGATVDWYNLEKSKRVKAFRCGEFDDCIERAEYSQGLPIKKREKYALREDAILHALELEKQLLKRQGLLGVTSQRNCSKSSVSLEKEPVTYSVNFENPKSHQFSNKLDTVHSDDIIGSPLYLQKVKETGQLGQEGDISEATPRIRGFLDSGMRITPSEKMRSSSVSEYGYEKDAFDHTSQALLTHGPSTDSTSQVNGKNSLGKRKKSHQRLASDILVKRCDRSHPLVHVLQNNAKLELPDCGTIPTSVSGVEQMVAVSCAKRSEYAYLPTNSSDSVDYKELPSSLIETPSSWFVEGSCRPQLGSFLQENASGFMDDAHSDSSESDSNDESSETEPDMTMTALSGSDPYGLGRPEPLEEYGNSSTQELEESAHSSETIRRLPANITVPRWKSKGKRNVRNPRRRSMDTLYGKASRHNLSFIRNDVYHDGVDDTDWNGKDVGGPMAVPAYRDYPLSSRRSFKRPNATCWEDQALWGRFCKDRQEYFDSTYGGRHSAKSFLVEVDLQVQASYQKEPVPFVSLTSKLNGKAIIGHPIQIEKLDDGSTETLVSKIDESQVLHSSAPSVVSIGC